MSFTSKISEKMLTKAGTSEKVACSSLWEDQDAVIYFLRRFGCPVCRWISKEISAIEPTLSKNGVKLIGVGPEVVGADEFLAGKYFAGDLYIDETKEVYQGLGFSRFSMMGAIGAAVDKETRTIHAEAKKIGMGGNFKGDLKQLGGLLIVKKGGEQVKYFKQDKASEYMKNSEILQALGIDETNKDNVRPDMTCPFNPSSK